MNRRTFLLSSGAAAAAAALPRRAVAASAADRRFLFVFARGGWDPTRVFAPEFANGNVDMEAEAERASDGDLTWVDHPERPSVGAFFAANAARSVLLNGVQVRSINHEVCTYLALTGGASGLTPDWPAILGAAQADRYALPHLVVGGVSLPGDLGAAVARSGQNGQLEALLSGEIVGWSDLPAPGVARSSEGIIDRYLLRRAAAAKAAARGAGASAMADAYADALDKALALKDYRSVMDFTAGSDLASQAGVAVEALATGLSRCVTLGFDGGAALGWDSHADNDATQSELFEALFSGLNTLMALLDATPGPGGTTLSEDTVVVVFSEMGRTPQLNATLGKDHWPYTSALLVGSGLDAGRSVGGYDDGYAGQPLDYASGEVDEGGTLVTAEALGATLLQLGDVDPEAWVQGARPITGILA